MVAPACAPEVVVIFKSCRNGDRLSCFMNVKSRLAAGSDLTCFTDEESCVAAGSVSSSSLTSCMFVLSSKIKLVVPLHNYC